MLAGERDRHLDHLWLLEGPGHLVGGEDLYGSRVDAKLDEPPLGRRMLVSRDAKSHDEVAGGPGLRNERRDDVISED